MSIRHVRAALDVRDARLRSSDRFVLTVLAEHANADTHRCWPSLDRIEAETGLARGTVKSSITRLVDFGYVEVLSEAGGRRSRLYGLAGLVGGQSQTRYDDGAGAVGGQSAAGRHARRGSVGDPEPEGTTKTPTVSEPEPPSLPLRQRADAITREWWEATVPRPTQGFVAARKVVERLLGSFSDSQVRSAIRGQRTLTVGYLDARLAGTVGRQVDNRHVGDLSRPEHDERRRLFGG